MTQPRERGRSVIKVFCAMVKTGAARSGYRVPMRYSVRVVRAMIDPECVALTPHGPATIQPWSIDARLGRQIGVLEVTSGEKLHSSGKLKSRRRGGQGSTASKSWMRFPRTEA